MPHTYRYCLALLVIGTLALATSPQPLFAAACARPENYTETIRDTLVRFDMVGVPGGEIEIADPAAPGAKKRVKIAPFWIGKTEVTWDEYDVFVFRLDEPETMRADAKDAVSRPSKPYGMADRGFGHKGYPVINESFLGAEAYCRWLSAKTGKKYRLPTEAEWEYACRAGMPDPDKTALERMAWFWQDKTQPVGKKSPNAWGIHDMLGNVAEWCTDLAGKPVLCGGAWDDMARDVKATARRRQEESWQANDPQNPKSKWWFSDAPFAGFRVVRTE